MARPRGLQPSAQAAGRAECRGCEPLPDGASAPGLVAAETRAGSGGWEPRGRNQLKVRKPRQSGPAFWTEEPARWGPMSRSRLGFPPKADRLPDTCSSLGPLNPESPTPGKVNSEHRPGRSPGECPGRQVGKLRAEVHPLALDAGAHRRPPTLARRMSVLVAPSLLPH